MPSSCSGRSVALGLVSLKQYKHYLLCLRIVLPFQISEAACNPTYLQCLLEALVQGLSAEPRVASNVCWAFSSLADAAYEAAEPDSEETPQTYCLSAFFDPIVQKLLETTGRFLSLSKPFDSIKLSWFCFSVTGSLLVSHVKLSFSWTS